MSEKLKRYDINMIDYYINNIGDIERWPEWREKKEIISKQFPELIKAMAEFEKAKENLRKVSSKIVRDSYKIIKE